MTATTTKRITRATAKAFIRKGFESGTLHIRNDSKFDGMTDGVEYCEDRTFSLVRFTNKHHDYTLGVAGAWFVGGGRDSFSHFEDDRFTGIRVYNSCGSFVLAVPKS